MADINFKEKRFLEQLLKMGGGFVLLFSNRTFQEFIIDSVNVDIYNEKYLFKGESKANRLRAFWELETNYLVGTLIENLVDFWLSLTQSGEINFDKNDEVLHSECLKISERLKKDSIVEDIEVIREIKDEREFSLLSKSIKDSIEKNEPEVALDRLHTYLVKYVRYLCNNHKIENNRDEPLNSIFGKYIKFLIVNKKIDSIMSERILKYSIHVMEAFNDIRNNKSFAHDNLILNYSESILIFKNVTNSIKFIESIEQNLIKENEKTTKILVEDNLYDDLPF